MYPKSITFHPGSPHANSWFIFSQHLREISFKLLRFVFYSYFPSKYYCSVIAKIESCLALWSFRNQFNWSNFVLTKSTRHSRLKNQFTAIKYPFGYLDSFYFNAIYFRAEFVANFADWWFANEVLIEDAANTFPKACQSKKIVLLISRKRTFILLL